MNESHPCDERFGIVKWTAGLTDVHPGKEIMPVFNEIK